MGLGIYRLRQSASAAVHNFQIRGISGTAPLQTDPAGPLYIGMTCHRDALSWLVAVKSIATFVGPGTFVALNDGSLTEQDNTLLSSHLLGLRVLPVRDVDTQGCPRGGTWERLFAILDLTDEHYVVQVDSDLVATSPLPEVTAAVKKNRGFILSGEPGVTLKSLTAAAAAGKLQTYDHIQHAVESIIDELPDAETLHYVRGCSGFAGFPRGTARDGALNLSRFMVSRFGQRWHEWGTEQVTTNFVIANTPDPVVLPWDRYPAFRGVDHDVSRAALVHFIGGHRYEGGVFTTASRTVIRRLLTPVVSDHGVHLHAMPHEPPTL